MTSDSRKQELFSFDIANDIIVSFHFDKSELDVSELWKNDSQSKILREYLCNYQVQLFSVNINEVNGS